MSKILICGEAWGAEEAIEGKPFVGPSGRLLRGLLYQSGIAYDECYVTNVFNLQPKPKNDIINLCGGKADGIPGYPSLQKSKYVRAEYKPELERLFREIDHERPNLILALGATAAWALLKTSGIKNIRGTPHVAGVLGRSYKVLPTYHPAAILREWALRPIVLSDLDKAKRESEYQEVRRPRREVWIAPTLSDLAKFEQEHILPSPDLSIDIETSGRMITCVGFAPTPQVAIVIPFVKRNGDSYWPTHEDELEAWSFVRRWCSLKKHIVGQNGLYDINFLWTEAGIPILHYEDDTMLMHHAMQPEMEKGLGFLSSVYTSEQSWKFMRKNKTIKRED